MVEIDATGFLGRTGLCPGQVTLDDGSTMLAYRFIEISEEAAESLTVELGKEIEKLQRAAHD